MMPAISGSIMIRPQYSQTMIFLPSLMSICFWGGILLKQPPQAPLCTGTIPSPLRAFLRIRLYAASRRGSMEASVFFAFSRIFSSCALVSETISASSFFFCSRSAGFFFQQLNGSLNLFFEGSDILCKFTDMFLGEFNFQGFKFNLLRKVIILLAVTHIVELRVIFLKFFPCWYLSSFSAACYSPPAASFPAESY